MSYNAKNYNKQGSEETVIGGELNIDGGKITKEGTQASAIADHGDTSSATNEQIADKQNDILAALRGVGIIASE